MLSCPVVQLFLSAFPEDKRLGIKAQTNCSEFALVFCCTEQLLLKVFHGSPLTPCFEHKPERISQSYPKKSSNSVYKPSIFQSRALKGTYLAISSDQSYRDTIGALCLLRIPNTTRSNSKHLHSWSFPLGLSRPVDRSLEDKILRGEYIDFALLLPDNLYQSQNPEIQLCLDDASLNFYTCPYYCMVLSLF